MRIKGRIINSGKATAGAVVLDVPFSFIGDFDPQTGKLQLSGHLADGLSIAGKILVIPTGKGGTIAPWIAFEAAKNKVAPAGILCINAEPITCESAITIDIPMVCEFENPIKAIETGLMVTIDEDVVEIHKW